MRNPNNPTTTTQMRETSTTVTETNQGGNLLRRIDEQGVETVSQANLKLLGMIEWNRRPDWRARGDRLIIPILSSIHHIVALVSWYPVGISHAHILNRLGKFARKADDESLETIISNFLTNHCHHGRSCDPFWCMESSMISIVRFMDDYYHMRIPTLSWLW